MYFDIEDIIKVSVTFSIIILFLEAYLSVFIILASKEQVIGWFNFKVVNRAKRMHRSL